MTNEQPKASRVLAEMQNMCAQLSKRFTPEMRITIIVRDPADPRAYLLASDDDLQSLGKALITEGMGNDE